MNLLALPEELIACIIDGWLNLHDLTRLDTAFCCTKYRQNFLKLLQKARTDEKQIIHRTNCSAISWMAKRSIGVKSAHILLYGFNDESDYQKFLGWVQVSGEAFQYLELTRFITERLKPFLACCNNLQTLALYDCAVAGCWNQVCSMPQLTALYVNSQWDRYGDETTETHNKSNRVKKLKYHTIKIDTKVFQYFPNIRSLDLYGSGEETPIDSIILATCNCPRITNLKIKYGGMTDAAFGSALGYLTSGLNSLHVTRPSRTTDAILDLITTHSTHTRTLRHLCIEYNDKYTVRAVINLLNSCTHLETLHLYYFSTVDTITILNSVTLPSVLILNIITEATAELVTSIVTHHKYIHCLGLYFPKHQEQPCDPEFLQLLTECPMLRLVVLRNVPGGGITAYQLRKQLMVRNDKVKVLCDRFPDFDVLSYPV